MARSSFVQSSFLGGEWSPYAQGKIDSPVYKTGMNVCRNGYPLEEGAWIRRSGTRLGGPTYQGKAGRIIAFDFEQAFPYNMEFTDARLRFWGVSTQTQGLTNTLQQDFRLVTTNDNQQVLSVSTANPAVVQTGTHGWTTGDEVQILFDVSVSSAFTPLLRNRNFAITVTDPTHFSIADAVTGTPIDGSTLGWATPSANTVVAARVSAVTTPYTSSAWATIRKVQAETQAILLQGSFAPRTLNATSLPTSSAFAKFSLTTPQFLDGPYLDPPTDGTTLTPTPTAATLGVLPSSGQWSDIAWNGAVFATVLSGSAQAATSPDGITWTARTLPSTSPWSAVAWNGTVFCAIAGVGAAGGASTNVAATSTDGVTWTARTLPNTSQWSSIAWNGTIFCAVAWNGPTATSADGITWVSHVHFDGGAVWVSIAAIGSKFCMVGYNFATGTFVSATSTDGATWTEGVINPVGVKSPTSVTQNGTVFLALATGTPGNPGAGPSALTSSDGLSWIVNTMPAGSWKDVAWNGSIFAAIGGAATAATSSDGVTWISQALPPIANNLDAIAAGTASLFVAVSAASNVSMATTFASFSYVASTLSSINAGAGFQATDVGRTIRILSEPALYLSTTSYAAGVAVKYFGIYYVSLASSNQNNQPDVSPTKWEISDTVAGWTWGNITSILSTSSVTVAIAGTALLNPSATVFTFRLGVYSATTGYPTCGVYYEGRLWLSGAVANRVDASKSNDIFNFAPTQSDGVVADNNAISYTFNSVDVNPILWMIGQANSIACGTQAREWQIISPTAGPITPTNIAARTSTEYGSKNAEAISTQLTISFIQRFARTVLEYFPDSLSGKYTAPNLTENAKHLTSKGLEEIRYQQELLPIIWARTSDGMLLGATYERDSLFSSQPAKFIGWHRHDFENGNTVESLAVGPSLDGNTDTLVMVQNEGGLRHVEIMQSVFKPGDTIQTGWFVDDGLVPSGGVISGTTLTLNGLWHLNGNTCAVTVGGVDLGDFAVTNGSVSVTIDASPNDLLTTAYLVSISSATAYGVLTCPVESSQGRLYVPAVVGFTFISQGQLLRPDTLEETRSPMGPGLGKPRTVAQMAALLSNTQGIKFGTDFGHMRAAQLNTPGTTKALSSLQLFSGVYWQTIDGTYDFDSMICWQIDRPYPAIVVSVAGYLATSER